MNEVKIDFPSATKEEAKRLSKAIKKLPSECHDFLNNKKMMFVKNEKDTIAFFLKNRAISEYDCTIILNQEVWTLNDDEFLYVIAHEIIHYLLGHDNVKEIGKKEEKEAYDLTTKWLKEILCKK